MVLLQANLPIPRTLFIWLLLLLHLQPVILAKFIVQLMKAIAGFLLLVLLLERHYIVSLCIHPILVWLGIVMATRLCLLQHRQLFQQANLHIHLQDYRPLNPPPFLHIILPCSQVHFPAFNHLLYQLKTRLTFPRDCRRIIQRDSQLYTRALNRAVSLMSNRLIILRCFQQASRRIYPPICRAFDQHQLLPASRHLLHRLSLLLALQENHPNNLLLRHRICLQCSPPINPHQLPLPNLLVFLRSSRYAVQRYLRQFYRAINLH